MLHGDEDTQQTQTKNTTLNQTWRLGMYQLINVTDFQFQITLNIICQEFQR